MDNQGDHIQFLLQNQREKIKALQRENMRLKILADTLRNRINELKGKQKVIDSAIGVTSSPCLDLEV